MRLAGMMRLPARTAAAWFGGPLEEVPEPAVAPETGVLSEPVGRSPGTPSPTAAGTDALVPPDTAAWFHEEVSGNR